MNEQLDLFEELEKNSIYEKSKRQAKRKSNLVDRQHRLVDWLKEHFVSGRFYSIEEIVEGVRDSNGDPYYTLNTDPYKHDKCIALSNDVRAINWAITDRYSLIIKDSKGGCKLVESKAEFETWRVNELAPIEKKCKYLNNLVWKDDRQDTVPLVNLSNRALAPEEMKPIDVYAKEELL